MTYNVLMGTLNPTHSPTRRRSVVRTRIPQLEAVLLWPPSPVPMVDHLAKLGRFTSSGKFPITKKTEVQSEIMKNAMKYKRT